MSKEIERKFLVKSDAWREIAKSELYRQGYLSAAIERTVRIRTVGDNGFITIKGACNGISRTEFEYAIPAEDASEMLDTLCLKPLIEKLRYRISHKHHVWEVDEFLGENAGLVVAEVELMDAQEQIDLPPWIGMEVSDDARYFNSNLVLHPYKRW